ncbi:MAG TPA: DMT family transporter [Micromonosporaceae bacterium]
MPHPPPTPVPSRISASLGLRTVGAVIVAVVAVSSAAPLIAFAAAPALVVAFWRNALAVGALGAFAAVRRRAEFVTLLRSDPRHLRYCVLAGAALAAHFGTWTPSVHLTSVAAATALVATQPVWQGMIAVRQGRSLSAATWVGIAVTVVGAVLATGADFGVSGRAVLGDLLALIGGLAGAVYTALGEQARVAVSTTVYTTICYGVCALLLAVAAVAFGLPMVGFEPTTWAAILGLVVGAQLLGHSLFNYVLRRVAATTVSVLLLLEVPGAALIAWVWLGQAPRPAALPGLALLVIGVAVVVLGSTRGRPTPDPRSAGSSVDTGCR